MQKRSETTVKYFTILYTSLAIFFVIAVAIKVLSGEKQNAYVQGYEQGCWDSFLYSNSIVGERYLMSSGFRKYLCETKASPQTTEEIWKLADKYLGGKRCYKNYSP
jgi:hypothetical protein